VAFSVFSAFLTLAHLEERTLAVAVAVTACERTRSPLYAVVLALVALCRSALFPWTLSTDSFRIIVAEGSCVLVGAEIVIAYSTLTLGSIVAVHTDASIENAHVPLEDADTFGFLVYRILCEFIIIS
jgi:hypothetical protein